MCRILENISDNSYYNTSAFSDCLLADNIRRLKSESYAPIFINTVFQELSEPFVLMPGFSHLVPRTGGGRAGASQLLFISFLLWPENNGSCWWRDENNTCIVGRVAKDGALNLGISSCSSPLVLNFCRSLATFQRCAVILGSQERNLVSSTTQNHIHNKHANNWPKTQIVFHKRIPFSEVWVGFALWNPTSSM